MFSLPSIPTDNLYKFIFISSIALFIYSSYLTNNLDIDLANEKVAFDSISLTRQELRRIDSIRIIETTKRLEDWNASMLKSEKEMNKLIEEGNIQTSQYESYSSMLSTHNQTRVVEVAKRDSLTAVANQDNIRTSLILAKMQSRLKIDKRIVSDSKNYLILSFFLFVTGSLTWLLRVQIPQDKLTKLNILLSEAQLRKALKDENNVQPVTSETVQPDETTS